MSAAVLPQQFREGMRRLAGAVTIIATRNGSERHGLTATAACSLSAEPARLLACVNVAGGTFQSLLRSRCMSVNVLAADQDTLARRFAGLAGDKSAELFDPAQWTEGVTGAPLLRTALVAFDCAVDEMLLSRTHAVVLGDIKGIEMGREGAPLLYVDRAFVTTRSSGPVLNEDWMDYPWM